MTVPLNGVGRLALDCSLDGNRTADGAVTQHTIASVFRTCHQQTADPFAIIEELLRSPVAQVASLPSLASGP